MENLMHRLRKMNKRPRKKRINNINQCFADIWRALMHITTIEKSAPASQNVYSRHTGGIRIPMSQRQFYFQ